MNELQIIKGIECFADKEGIIQLKLENVCWGLGFTKSEIKNKKEYASIRWERVFSYLDNIGFDHKGAKDIFIPEPVFYLLAMKAESEKAKVFQKVVAYEILPTIRKHGMYVAPKLSKEIQAIFALDEKQIKLERDITEVKKDLTSLEDNMPLFNCECKELQSLVKKKGIEVLGGYRCQAYNDNSLRQKVYQDIQRQIKREFGVNRYEAILRRQYVQAKNIIAYYVLPLVLEGEVTLLNNQIEF